MKTTANINDEPLSTPVKSRGRKRVKVVNVAKEDEQHESQIKNQDTKTTAKVNDEPVSTPVKSRGRKRVNAAKIAEEDGKQKSQIEDQDMKTTANINDEPLSTPIKSRGRKRVKVVKVAKEDEQHESQIKNQDTKTTAKVNDEPVSTPVKSRGRKRVNAAKIAEEDGKQKSQIEDQDMKTTAIINDEQLSTPVKSRGRKRKVQLHEENLFVTFSKENPSQNQDAQLNGISTVQKQISTTELKGRDLKGKNFRQKKEVKEDKEQKNETNDSQKIEQNSNIETARCQKRKNIDSVNNVIESAIGNYNTKSMNNMTMKKENENLSYEQKEDPLKKSLKRKKVEVMDQSQGFVSDGVVTRKRTRTKNETIELAVLTQSKRSKN
uniref:CSON010501 protein n=1 Tax=Culicoides sonorensis TaxID=179676 RepID=A0A336M5J6_CULSO